MKRIRGKHMREKRSASLLPTQSQRNEWSGLSRANRSQAERLAALGGGLVAGKVDGRWSRGTVKMLDRRLVISWIAAAERLEGPAAGGGGIECPMKPSHRTICTLDAGGAGTTSATSWRLVPLTLDKYHETSSGSWFREVRFPWISVKHLLFDNEIPQRHW